MIRIAAENATIDFPIYDANARSLRHSLLLNGISNVVSRPKHSVGGQINQDRRGHMVVRALDQVSFSIADGDRVGLIGHNGAGKTTLLRALAGIYEPTSGEITTRGRVMPLFNMTEGMMPDATGMELIRTRGCLLGLTDGEIKEHANEVIEFCELGDYIHMPVRTYSTGMLVRLAFAITTTVSSDILLMDELIGAGDAAFVDRAQARLRRFVDQARVMVVASHSTSILEQWCNKAMLLEHGRIVEFADIASVLNTYKQMA